MQLKNKNIDETVKKVEKFFESANVSHKDKIKICLLLEESLLRFQEKFGEDCNFKFVTRKWLGTPKILIKIKGTPYNPIEDNSDKQIFSEQIIKNLSNYEKAEIIYRYENGYFAFIIQNFSESTQKIIAENLVTPILDKLFGVIIAVNIPLIFISIIASICAIENISVLHDLSIKVFKKFFQILIFATISTVCISAIFFPVINFNFSSEISSQDYTEMQKIFDLILSIIPQNFFIANIGSY